MKSFVVTLALCGAALAAQAQTVYRCGPDGRSYADSPCKDGRAVDVGDARSAEQARAAADAARREQVMADGLRRERHAREAEGSRRGVVALGPASAQADRPAATGKVIGKGKGKKKDASAARQRLRLSPASPGPTVPKAPVQRAGQASA